MARLRSSFAVLALLFTQTTYSIQVTLSDDQSVIGAAKTIADDLISYYVGNSTAAVASVLPYPPYFWWETGAMWGVMLDYWYATGDDTYNAQASVSIQAQVGEHQDFMPADQAFDMGNDDQAFWALTALTAAETNFQNPPEGDPSWLGLAQAVYNEQIGRWDNSSCGGGIHWQVNPSGGFHLKNTISNGALMQLAARLARYTQDDQYAQWANKLWDWMWAVKLIDNQNWSVYDNTDANLNCTSVDRAQWTYNAGTLLIASATMYNYTNGDPTWKNRITHLLSTLIFDFFPNGIMTELCEVPGKCNNDELTFKAYLSRWMAMTTQMAPFTSDTIMPVLMSSATAAMEQCSGTFFPNNCGLRWSQNATWDGSNGPGQQMAALEVLLGTIIKKQSAPLTNSTGGTSASNPNAGFNGSAVDPGSIVTPATHGDKVGAWFLTVVFIMASVAGCYFLWSPSFELRGNLYNGAAGGSRGLFSSMNFGSSNKIEKSTIHMGGLMSST